MLSYSLKYYLFVHLLLPPRNLELYSSPADLYLHLSWHCSLHSHFNIPWPPPIDKTCIASRISTSMSFLIFNVSLKSTDIFSKLFLQVHNYPTSPSLLQALTVFPCLISQSKLLLEGQLTVNLISKFTSIIWLYNHCLSWMFIWYTIYEYTQRLIN